MTPAQPVPKKVIFALLEIRTEASDSLFAKHLESTSSRSTYTSNLEEVQEAEYFSVIADEATGGYKYTYFYILIVSSCSLCSNLLMLKRMSEKNLWDSVSANQE